MSSTVRAVSHDEPVERAPVEAGFPGRPKDRSSPRVAVIATALGLLAFLLVQALLAAYNLDVLMDAIGRGLYQAASWERLTFGARLLPTAASGSLAYLAIASVGCVVAAAGHRRIFALPALCYVFAPFLGGAHPEAIGPEWRIECFTLHAIICDGPWFAHPWFGATVDVLLVLLPGFAIARLVDQRRWPGRTDPAAIAAIVTSVAAVVAAGWAILVIEAHLDLRTIVSVGALGIVVGTTRPWWPWLQILFAAFAIGMFGLLLDPIFWPDPDLTALDALPYGLEELWPIVTVGLLASAWQPLAWTIRRLQECPIRLAIAVNVLNAADAALTLFAVRTGEAFESNPLVRLIGLPAKIVLVGLLTWILWRRKPSALVWPLAALLCVNVYHVAGIFVNGGW